MIQAKLCVLQQEIELLWVNMDYHRDLRRNGRPASEVMGGLIKACYATDANTDRMLRWMTKESEDAVTNKEIDKMEDGKVCFYDNGFDYPPTKTYAFNDAHLIYFKEVLNVNGSDPMQTIITISPAVQNYGAQFLKYWCLNRISPSEVMPYQPSVSENPITQIIHLKWVNSDTQENDITEIGYKESASLIANIENAQGSTATITIKKEDGSEFENGQTQLTFTEAIKDGMVELTPMEIKEQWEEFKTSDIDKLIANVEHGGAAKTSKPLTVVPPPKAIVDFRPAKKYNGEYGFDYMRDKSEKKDKLTYKDILGTNTTTVDPITKKETNTFTPYLNSTKYDSLKNSHYNTITFPWYKDANNKEIEYIQSWLTLYPKQTVTLSLQINTIENSAKKEFTFEYDKKLFRLSTEKIPAQKKGEKRLKDHLQIECLAEFGTDQIIKVMDGTRQLGQLIVLKNNKQNRYKTNILFVKVNTQLVSGSILKSNTTGEQAFLEKYLNQALITPTVVTEVLNLTNDTTFNTKFASKGQGYIDSRTGIHAYLNGKMNAKYKNYLKVYFIPDKCPVLDKNGVKISRVNGQAMGIGADAVVVFGGHGKATTTHEALHALGIRHTFDNSATYGYKKGETQNIMDYSHQAAYGSKKRILTWLWQWKKLWTNALVTKE